MGKSVLGRRLALLGPVGQRALAHGVHSLERSREVWAAWRALLLPCEEGAAGGFGRVVHSLRLCGNAQGVRADWSASVGSRRRCWVQLLSVSGIRRHVEIQLP